MKKKVISIFAVLALLLAFTPSMVFAGITDLTKTATYEGARLTEGGTVTYTVSFTAAEGIWTMEDLLHVGFELDTSSIRFNGVAIESMAASEWAIASQLGLLNLIGLNNDVIANKFSASSFVLAVDATDAEVLAWLEDEVPAANAVFSAYRLNAQAEAFEFIINTYPALWSEFVTSVRVAFIQDIADYNGVSLAVLLTNYGATEVFVTEAIAYLAATPHYVIVDEVALDSLPAAFTPAERLDWVQANMSATTSEAEILAILSGYEAAAVATLLYNYTFEFGSFILTESLFFYLVGVAHSSELLEFLAIDFTTPAFWVDGSTLWVVGDYAGSVEITFEVKVLEAAAGEITNLVFVDTADGFAYAEAAVYVYVAGGSNQGNNQGGSVVVPPVFVPPAYTSTQAVTYTHHSAPPHIPYVPRNRAQVAVQDVQYEIVYEDVVSYQPEYVGVIVIPTPPAAPVQNVTATVPQDTDAALPVVTVTAPTQTVVVPAAARVNPQTGDTLTSAEVLVVVAMMMAFAGILVSAIVLFSMAKKRRTYR